MRKPRVVVSDAPAQAQSIDVEEWKKERDEEMKALETITLYKEGGKSINVNDCDVDEYFKKGWFCEPVNDKPSINKPKPAINKPIPSVTKPSSVTGNTK